MVTAIERKAAHSHRFLIEPPVKDATDSGWYVTSGPELPLVAQKGESHCDVLVTGAGWMGLHAARRCRELAPDQSVILVDAGRIGNNASERCMGLPNPPLHLLLGLDALRRGEHKLSDMTREMRAWKAETVSTDFPEGQN